MELQHQPLRLDQLEISTSTPQQISFSVQKPQVDGEQVFLWLDLQVLPVRQELPARKDLQDHKVLKVKRVQPVLLVRKGQSD